MLSRNYYQNNFTLLDGATEATNAASPFLLPYRHITLALAVEDSPDLTIKFYATAKNAIPDISQGQSHDNHFAGVQVIDLIDGSTTNGGTGFTLTAATCKNLEVNTNSISYLVAEVSGYTSGTVYLYGAAAT